MDQRDILLTMIAEAFGEGDEGMRRVGETILNRAAIRGIDPVDVVRQPHQYTGYSAPGPAAVAAQRDPSAISAAQAAWELARQPGDPTGGADHYHADYVDPGWASSMPSTGKYGQHLFYKSTDVPADALRALLTPTAPMPQMPPARGNAPTTLVADSFKALPQRQPPSGLSPLTIKSVVDMFAEPMRDATPRMNRDGSVTDPSNVVFGQQMAKDIWPQKTTARLPEIAPPNATVNKSAITTASARRAADLLTLRNANQSAADAERNKTVVASFPTTGVGAPPAIRNVQSVTKPVQAGQAGQASAPPTALQATAKVFGATEYNPNAHGFAGPKIVAGPNAPPKSAERLPSASGIDLVNTQADDFAPYGLDVVQFDTAFAPMPQKRPTTRTITERVPNPDWTADLATTKVPAGMKVNLGSRDTVAQRAAGAKVPQFITRTRQVPVIAPAAVAPKRAPVPFSRPAPVALQRPMAPHVWMTGFSGSESSGGAHGGSENDKHRGEVLGPGRNH